MDWGRMLLREDGFINREKLLSRIILASIISLRTSMRQQEQKMIKNPWQRRTKRRGIILEEHNTAKKDWPKNVAGSKYKTKSKYCLDLH